MRYLRRMFFSYRVNDTTKPFEDVMDMLDNFLQQGHYIIGSVEIMHPENQGLLLFYKHKDELNEKERGKLEKNRNRDSLASYA